MGQQRPALFGQQFIVRGRCLCCHGNNQQRETADWIKAINMKLVGQIFIAVAVSVLRVTGALAQTPKDRRAPDISTPSDDKQGQLEARGS